MHIGRIETERVKDRKQYLLDCWHGKIQDSPSKFMVATTIDASDEWLHSFYYYNDEIPAEEDFMKSVADYLTFEFNMISYGRRYLFEDAGINKTLFYTEIPPLSKKTWKEFYLTDIFYIKPGKRLTKSDMRAGNRPFIGATDSNNGITAFVSNTNNSIDQNILGVNYNGSVVETFYHPYECIFSDDVKRFELKNNKNKYVYKFLKQAIIQQKQKFTYGYKFNEARMNKQKILLPVTKEDKPDYEYMEQFIKNIEAEQLKKYMAYIKA
jgi:hypothetical protein